MKNRIALDTARQAIRPLAIGSVLFWTLWYFWPHWAMLMFAVFLVVSLAVELLRVWWMQKKALEDPDFLDREKNGT